jgi:hypothetical protein
LIRAGPAAFLHESWVSLARLPRPRARALVGFAFFTIVFGVFVIAWVFGGGEPNPVISFVHWSPRVPYSAALWPLPCLLVWDVVVTRVLEVEASEIRNREC